MSDTLFDLEEVATVPRRPAACACTPGVRCGTCRDRSAAQRRMFRLAGVTAVARKDVDYWDRQTSMSDARALLCVAWGIPVDQISRTGHAPTGWDFR